MTTCYGTRRLSSEPLFPHQAAHAAAHHLFRQAAFAQLLEHLAHLRVLAEKLVDILHTGSGAGGDALAARTGDDLVVAALVGSHRTDDRLRARELPFIDLT